MTDFNDDGNARFDRSKFWWIDRMTKEQLDRMTLEEWREIRKAIVAWVVGPSEINPPVDCFSPERDIATLAEMREWYKKDGPIIEQGLRLLRDDAAD